MLYLYLFLQDILHEDGYVIHNIHRISRILLPRICSMSGGKVIGVGVCVYICLWTKKIALAIDSLFQTFAVRLLVKFIDKLYCCFLQKSFPH